MVIWVLQRGGDDFFFGNWLNNGTQVADTHWHLHVATQNDQDQGNTWTDLKQTTVDGSGSGGTWWPGKIFFGGTGLYNEYSKAEVAEFIAISDIITTEERQKLESYLAHKWGLSSMLPSSHPYKAASPIADPRALETYHG